MLIDLSYQETDDYLSVSIIGEWTSDDTTRVIDEIAREARARHHTRIFIDARLLSKSRNDYDRYIAGEHIAKAWRHLKVAILARAEMINKFTENTAVNRGADIIVLSDIHQALSWLMEGKEDDMIKVPDRQQAGPVQAGAKRHGR